MNDFNTFMDGERFLRDHETLGWYFHACGLPEEPREAKGLHVQHHFPGLPCSAGSLCWINDDNWIPSTFFLRCTDRLQSSRKAGKLRCEQIWRRARLHLSKIWFEINENTSWTDRITSETPRLNVPSCREWCNTAGGLRPLLILHLQQQQQQ